jgi:phosphatidylserine/phosphatidylglycerophosphate/cardiolipin synthase-like enzyme
MADLWMTIAELAVVTHADRIDIVVDTILNQDGAMDRDRIQRAFGPNVDQALIVEFFSAWRNAPTIKAAEIASAFKTAIRTTSIMESCDAIDLVWTGPSTGLVPMRHTEQVLCELIDSAMARIFLVSFVAYGVDSIVGALRRAIARGVGISILLESSQEHGGTIDHDSIAVLKSALPTSSFYVWSEVSKQATITQRNSVHAKCAVADGSIAFITSANLSVAAMERNMELGVLIRGGAAPKSLQRHLEALVTTGVIELTE